MKKLFLLLTLLFVSLLSQSQTRFVPDPGQSNCYGSQLPYIYQSLTEASGVDTVTYGSSYYFSLGLINHSGADTLVDSLTVNFSVTGSQMYIGDRILLGVKTGSRTTTVLRFTGNATLTTGLTRWALSTANKSWWIEFVFNGSKWIELYRTAY